MASTNLNVQFGGDASKLLGEMKLVEAQAKLLSKQIDAALKSGDTAKAGQLSQQFGTMKTQLGQLNQTAQQTGAIVPRALNDITRASARAAAGLEDLARSGMGIRRVVSQFSSMGRGLESIGATLGGLAGGFAGAFAGVAVVQAITWLLSNLDNVSKKLSELQKQAREAGVEPIALQAAGRQAMQAGQDAEVGAKGFASFATAVETAKAAMPKENTGGVQVMRGGEGGDKQVNAMAGLVQVMRGGVQDTLDFSNALKLLQVNLAKIKTPQDQVTAYENAIKRALQLGKQFPQEMNRVSQQIFGMPLETLKEIASNSEKLDALIKKLAASAAGATKPMIDANTQLKQSKNEVSIAFEELTASYSNWLISFQTANNKWLAGFISQTLPSWGSAIKQGFQDILTSFVEGWQATMDLFKGIDDQFFADMLTGWTDFWDSVGQLASKTFDWIVNKATEAANAFRNAVTSVTGGAPAGDPSIPAMPMAAGGAVVGPGTATSDSVLARLSAGEYVMRARAVDHWGPHFMARLNALRNPFGFAGGGMVMPQRSLPRFADGGMVTARTADGTVVNLHFPGGSFSLRADAEIVGGLTREARRAGMLSAGRMAGALA